MATRARRTSRPVKIVTLHPDAPLDDAPHVPSGTAVAIEALRTGIVPLAAARRPEHIPHETSTIQVGDPDDVTLQNEYNGEDTPGGSTPTPDQNDVDKIGRAYGLQDEDNGGTLRSASEVLERRDRKRSELRPPRTPRS